MDLIILLSILLICALICMRHIPRDYEATDDGRSTLNKGKDIYEINFYLLVTEIEEYTRK